MEEVVREVVRRRAIVENYSRNYVECLHRGDYAKASELLWGIVNNLASILSILYKGKPISDHRELRMFMRDLAVMRGISEVVEWFRACELLHANYYHNFMDKEMFEDYRVKAEKLINTLQKLIEEKMQELRRGLQPPTGEGYTAECDQNTITR